nr:MAG: arginine--tRNA ligase [Bacillota bacterium]
MQEVQNQIRAALRAAVAAAAEAAGLTGPGPGKSHPEAPKEKAHGDLATNLALVMARGERKPPRAVAEAILRHLDLGGTWAERVEVAGPGFLNFFLKPGWLHQVLVAVQQEGENYGKSDHGQGKRVLLEYISANPTGPVVLVQARAGAVGSTLARLLNWAGYRCDTEFYVNDAGNQVKALARAVDLRARQLAGENVEFTGEYPAEYVIDCARDLLKQYPDFLQKPEEERLAFLERWAPEYFRAGQEEVLRRYGVVFDNWFSERKLRESGAVEALIQRLKEMGEAYEADGAVWMRTTKYGDDKDRVLVKSDGEYTYFCADAAYHLNKYERGYDLLINIWGQDHHGYQGRMKAMVQCLGRPPESLELLITQLVRLVKDGQEYKMSKRQGNIVELEDLLEEVSVDAARFFFLMRSLDSHMDFDINLANLASQENPVYYVQYAHARICSLLRQAEEAGYRVPDAASVRLEVLQDPAELDLLKKIAELPEEIIHAAESREPHRIARYVMDVAALFHAFYNRCRVLGAESEELTRARLVLADATRVVIRNVLGLMGVSAPERM